MSDFLIGTFLILATLAFLVVVLGFAVMLGRLFWRAVRVCTPPAPSAHHDTE